MPAYSALSEQSIVAVVPLVPGSGDPMFFDTESEADEYLNATGPISLVVGPARPSRTRQANPQREGSGPSLAVRSFPNGVRHQGRKLTVVHRDPNQYSERESPYALGMTGALESSPIGIPPPLDLEQEIEDIGWNGSREDPLYYLGTGWPINNILPTAKRLPEWELLYSGSQSPVEALTGVVHALDRALKHHLPAYSGKEVSEFWSSWQVHDLLEEAAQVLRDRLDQLPYRFTLAEMDAAKREITWALSTIHRRINSHAADFMLQFEGKGDTRRVSAREYSVEAPSVAGAGEGPSPPAIVQEPLRQPQDSGTLPLVEDFRLRSTEHVIPGCAEVLEPSIEEAQTGSSLPTESRAPSRSGEVCSEASALETSDSSMCPQDEPPNRTHLDAFYCQCNSLLEEPLKRTQFSGLSVFPFGRRGSGKRASVYLPGSESRLKQHSRHLYPNL